MICPSCEKFFFPPTDLYLFSLVTLWNIHETNTISTAKVFARNTTAGAATVGVLYMTRGEYSGVQQRLAHVVA